MLFIGLLSLQWILSSLAPFYKKMSFQKDPSLKPANGRRKWVQCVYIYRQRYFTNYFVCLVPLQGLKWVEKTNLRNLKPKSDFFFNQLTNFAFRLLDVCIKEEWNCFFFLFAVLDCVLKFNRISILKYIFFTYYFEESICWTFTLKRKTFIDSFIILPPKQNACRYLMITIYFFCYILIIAN